MVVQLLGLFAKGFLTRQSFEIWALSFFALAALSLANRYRTEVIDKEVLLLNNLSAGLFI
jgi:hypothetical protein